LRRREDIDHIPNPLTSATKSGKKYDTPTTALLGGLQADGLERLPLALEHFRIGQVVGAQPAGNMRAHGILARDDKGNAWRLHNYPNISPNLIPLVIRSLVKRISINIKIFRKRDAKLWTQELNKL